MSQRQRLPESEAATALELLTLREEMSDLTLSEARLKLQVRELHSQIASYGPAASFPGAQEVGDAPERLAALQAQLADAQEQQAKLAAQKEALTARQQAAQKRLNTLRASLQRDASWSQSAPPWEEKTPPSPRRRSARPTVVLLFGVLLVVLLGAIIHARVSSLDFSLLGAGSSASLKNGSPEEASFYTPAKTAPTNQGCVTTIKYECYSPEYIQQALGLTPLYKSGNTGSGETIVLLGAGMVTNLTADLHQFDLAWGLPDQPPTILYPDGAPAPYTCPGGVDRLQHQNILDMEWAHAIAPGARLVLLIGSNAVSQTDPQANCVYTSVQPDIAYALNHSLGSIIFVGSGSSELGDVADTDPQKADVQQYLSAGHLLLQRAAAAQVTVVAAAGDSGATTPQSTAPSNQTVTYWPTHSVSWPASDPDALAIGGTTLTLGDAYDDDAYVSETAWTSQDGGSTGGGLSAVFAEPDYQQMVADQTLFQGKRGVPDATFPAANLLVYDSSQAGALIKANPEWKHWDVGEGTAIAAACWAGLIAIADQMHGQPLGLIQPALYRLQGQGLHDITSGSNTYAKVPGYQAQKGYDLVTGWGTPFAQSFVPALLQANDDASAGCGATQAQCT